MFLFPVAALNFRRRRGDESMRRRRRLGVGLMGEKDWTNFG
jgi:hypothetical protein